MRLADVSRAGWMVLAWLAAGTACSLVGAVPGLADPLLTLQPNSAGYGGSVSASVRLPSTGSPTITTNGSPTVTQTGTTSVTADTAYSGGFSWGGLGYVSGSASLDATASYGALSATGASDMTMTCNPCGGTGFGTGPIIVAAPIAAFSDSLSFASNTLAAGTPISVELTFSFTAQASAQGCQSNSACDASASTAEGYYYGAYGLPSLYDWQTLDSADNVTSVATYVIGSDLGSPLTVGTTGWAIDANIYGTTNDDSTNVVASSNASFSEVANVCVDVLTPGVTYTAASGATYCSADQSLPEPGTLALLSPALVALLALRPRRMRWRGGRFGNATGGGLRRRRGG